MIDEDVKFQTFETMKKDKIKDAVSLTEALNKIKTEDDFTPFIEAIRQAGKKHKFYDYVKGNRECICWNSVFYTGRKEEDIKAMTGFIYMDKDNLSDDQVKAYKALLINQEYVAAAWRSIGGRGIGCLMYCDQVTKENFKAIWNEIDELIGIEFDAQTNSLNRLNVISYDPEIFINENPNSFISKGSTKAESSHLACKSVFEFVSTNTYENQLFDTKKEKYTLIKENTCLYTYTSDSDGLYNPNIALETRFDESVYEGQDYKVFYTPVDFMKINTWAKIPEGRRNNSLVAIISQMFKINEDYIRRDTSEATKSLLAEVFRLNNLLCQPPMEAPEILKIFKHCNTRFHTGKLYTKAKKKTVSFSQSCTKSPKEKQSVAGKAGGEVRRLRTKKSIEDAVEVLRAGKSRITQDEVAKITKKSTKTVGKYWEHFKPMVKIHNKSLLT